MRRSAFMTIKAFVVAAIYLLIKLASQSFFYLQSLLPNTAGPVAR
jgi:hypothetical protein